MHFSAEQTPPDRAHTLTGDIRTHADFHSRILDRTRTVLVYLPPGYESSENRSKRYPVLYLHDGQNVFDGATCFIPGKEWRVDETAETLIRAGKIEPLIIVAVYNGGAERGDEYTPTRDARFNGGMGGRADEYGKMLVEELKPFIDRTYRTRRDADGTGMGGSSFGGLVTMYLGAKRPDVFRRLAVVSPSVWWDNRVLLKHIRDLKSRPLQKIWLDIGTKEGHRAVTDTRALRDALTAKGWTLDRDLSYLEADGAVHDEAAWAQRVEPMLRFLYPAR
jgi:predicted alpha/beta superfamily hydrolase